MVGCAWAGRIHGLRSNASLQSHAELDEAETLDEGDLGLLVSGHRALEEHLPAFERAHESLRSALDAPSVDLPDDPA